MRNVRLYSIQVLFGLLTLSLTPGYLLAEEVGIKGGFALENYPYSQVLNVIGTVRAEPTSTVPTGRVAFLFFGDFRCFVDQFNLLEIQPRQSGQKISFSGTSTCSASDIPAWNGQLSFKMSLTKSGALKSANFQLIAPNGEKAELQLVKPKTSIVVKP